MHRPVANLLRSGLWLACLMGLTGCQSARFYTQAIGGQWQILAHREPIPRIVANTSTPPQLRRQLELVLEFRKFAEKELGLRTGGHYLSYVDIGRPHVVWNVYAAPEFSLKDKTWRYPLVGALNYQGYFEEAKARAYAAQLAEEGLDVHVAGVDAYSTLGWFKDPVMSSFVNYPESALASVIFHELAHQRVFIAGETEFNEAFATAVERESVRRWLKARRGEREVAVYDAQQRQEDEFVALVLEARKKLEVFYAQSTNQPLELRREGKAKIMAGLRAEHERMKQSNGGRSGYDAWFADDLNNAQLNTVDTYHQLVPAFEQLLAEAKASLPDFYRQVEKVGRLPKRERDKEMARLAGEHHRRAGGL